MKKIMLLLSLLMLMAIPALAQTFNLTAVKQSDSPISIEMGKIEFSLLTEWKGQEFYQLKAPFTLKNVSGKDIRVYTISLYESDHPRNSSTLTKTSRLDKDIFKSGAEFSSSYIGDNYPKTNDYKTAITFVEFADGTTWRFSPEENK